ncbi:reverse transcriptase domain-containing protein [Tanacetum coccineum]
MPTMYLIASMESISTSLLAKKEEEQVPIYFVSRVLQGDELNYPGMEKLILALIKKEEKEKADTKPTKMKLSYKWKLFTDGAASSYDSGAGLMLIDPEGKEYTYALRFGFETTNNKAEYEALLAELRISQELEITSLAIFVDSQLLVNQIKVSSLKASLITRRMLPNTSLILKLFCEKFKKSI